LKFDDRLSVDVKRATLSEFLPIYLTHRQATRAEGTARREERFGRQISTIFRNRPIS
jgi:hypothetical protein